MVGLGPGSVAMVTALSSADLWLSVEGSCIVAMLDAFWCLCWILGCAVQNQWGLTNTFGRGLVLVKGLLCQITQLLNRHCVVGHSA